jgi:hypothetical protein
MAVCMACGRRTDELGGHRGGRDLADVAHSEKKIAANATIMPLRIALSLAFSGRTSGLRHSVIRDADEARGGDDCDERLGHREIASPTATATAIFPENASAIPSMIDAERVAGREDPGRVQQLVADDFRDENRAVGGEKESWSIAPNLSHERSCYD